MKARQVLGAGLAVAFTVAGCGSQNPPAATGATASGGAAASTGSAAPASAAGDPSCALAPPGMVGAALGGTVGQPSQAVNRTSVATVVLCQYSGASSDVVTIRFQNKENASAFAEGKSNTVADGMSVKDIAGFEDEAYVHTLSLGGGSALTTLVARKGTLQIEVIARASLSREETLESKIFAAA